MSHLTGMHPQLCERQELHQIRDTCHQIEDRKRIVMQGFPGSRIRSAWDEFGSQYPAMPIPLRLFGIGIEFLIKQDRKLLFDLVPAEQ